MSYAFAPPKALAALIIFAAHQRQANQQHYDSYNKINGKVIYIIHLLIRPSFFPPQSAGRIRAIYIFFLSAPFAMLVYNPLVKYERGSSSTEDQNFGVRITNILGEDELVKTLS